MSSVRAPVRPPVAERVCDAAYYQKLHETSTGYQHNNWLPGPVHTK
jgi:hypothetical protein